MHMFPALSLWRRWLVAPTLAILLMALGAASVAAADQAGSAAPTGGTPSLDPTALMAALLAAGGIFCLALGLRFQIARARVGARLDAVVGPSFGIVDGGVYSAALRRRTLQPLLAPIGPLVAWLSQVVSGILPEKQIERIRGNLTLAGLPYSRHLAQFLAAKAGLAVGVALLAGLYQARRGAPAASVLLYAVLGGVLGFYLPGVWLGQRMRRRREAVIKAFPDALDLLTISVGAGLGFDGAMLEVIQRWQNSLTEEFSAVLRDLKLGKSRRDALRDFASRTGVEDVGNFVAAVIQADELGTPMKEVLQIQSQQMRMHRRHRAEERAHKAVVKMLVPMVCFIFPALFVVLLGPAVPALSTALKGVAG
jgi:tight adherence protein C